MSPKEKTTKRIFFSNSLKTKERPIDMTLRYIRANVLFKYVVRHIGRWSPLQWGSALSVIVAIFTLLFLIVVPTNHYSALGSLIGGVGAFLAFVWIAVGLRVQISDLQTQNILRRYEVSDKFLTSLRVNLNIILDDVSRALNIAPPDRHVFDMDEVPFKLAQHENLRSELERVAADKDRLTVASIDKYCRMFEQAEQRLNSIEVDSHTTWLFNNSIYKRIYQIFKDFRIDLV